MCDLRSMTTNKSPLPRIDPCNPEEQSDAIRALLAVADETGLNASNICATLAHNPELFRKWLGFSGKLLAGALSPRSRELVILRVAWLCKSDYEWAHHARIGHRYGLSKMDLSQIMAGPESDKWSTPERALIQSVDELHASSAITDATWRILAQTYDEAQLIELLLLIGHYQTVAFAANSIGVQLEEEVEEYSFLR